MTSGECGYRPLVHGQGRGGGRRGMIVVVSVHRGRAEEER